MHLAIEQGNDRVGFDHATARSFRKQEPDQPSAQPIVPVPKIKHALKNLLNRCSLVVPECPRHIDLTARCIEEAITRGYISSADEFFGRLVFQGAVMVNTAYAHQSEKIQVFISLYTAFLMYLDDAEYDVVRKFNHRFVAREPQGSERLEHFAALLLELPDIFGIFSADMMTMSTMNLLNSRAIEKELKSMKLEDSALAFPAYLRALSGVAESYSLFIFPPELPLSDYIQALPDCIVYINSGNDVLSFYKEQLAGDILNRIYLTAQCRGIDPVVVLQEAAGETVICHQRIMNTLKAHKDALNAYLSFSQGYNKWHLEVERYKLRELDLELETQSHL